MLRKIAMSRTSAGDLNLVYLDSKGLPWVFKQTADGAWHGPTQIPVQTPQLSFQGIVGLGFFGLLGLDQKGVLWFTTQNGDTWNPGGFTLLPNSNPKVTFSDCDYCNVEFGPVLIVGVGSTGVAGGINLYCQLGDLAALSQPALVGLAQTKVSAIDIDVFSGPPETKTSTAVVFTSAQPVDILWSNDGVNWNNAAVQPPANRGAFNWTSVTLVPGNPNRTLQAIALNSADKNLYLFDDTSGAGSNWDSYGTLPNPDGLQFSNMAASIGADGHLQVIGLSGGLPYLIWQDSGGHWQVYQNSQGLGMQLPMNTAAATPIADLVTGIGDQGYLQVGYIGADGSIYVNWQNPQGAWGWYGPLP